MIFACHRINTIKELKSVPTDHGIEIDIRCDYDNLIVHHDPFKRGTLFLDILDYYNHKFIILNIKTCGIENKIRQHLEDYKIKDYFFLDCPFPYIHNLSVTGEKNTAIRFSEFESKETVLKMSGKASWVWVDCFTKFPLDYDTFKLFKECNFKICIVSPELQNQPEKIEVYKDFMEKNKIVPDMICTKKKFIEKWK